MGIHMQGHSSGTEGPFLVQVRPMDLYVTEYSRYTNKVSNPTVQQIH